GPDRAREERRPVRQEGVRPAEAPRREGRAATPGAARREADRAEREPGEVPRRAEDRAIQAGALSVLGPACGREFPGRDGGVAPAGSPRQPRPRLCWSYSSRSAGEYPASRPHTGSIARLRLEKRRRGTS